MVAVHDVTKSRPSLSPFALALNREMQRFRVNRHKVADQCGVPASTIERWQAGTGVPDVHQFKRLVGMFRTLAHTPPAWPSTNGSIMAPTVADRVVADIKKAAEIEERKHPEKPPAPQEFGDGLRRIIEENGTPISSVAQLMGLAGGAIHHWLDGGCNPSDVNLEKLCELFPELKIAMDVGAIKRPKTRTFKGKPGRAQSPQLSIVPPPAPIVAAPEPAKPRHLGIDTLSMRYGEARVACQAKAIEAKALLARVAEVERELGEAQKAVADALAALDAAIVEAGK